MKRRAYTALLTGLLLLLTVSVAWAQDAPRTSPLSAYAVSPIPSDLIPIVTIPSSFIANNIEGLGNTASDAADLLHPCWNNDPGGTIADNAGGYSIYMLVSFPGGTLNISTAGSNYDTVLSVFVSGGGNVACNDDTGDGPSQISAVLPSGLYNVMVSSFHPDAATPLNLSFSISYIPDGPIPSNDNSATPTLLTTGVAVTQTGIQHATDDAAELLMNADCPMFNSVWYKFIVPTTGTYIFTMHGTQVLTSLDAFPVFTAIGLYQGSTFLSCAKGETNAAVTAPVSAEAGVEVLLRVGTVNRNLLNGSKYRLKAVATNLKLTTNSTFEGSSIGWKTKKFVAGDGYNIAGDFVVINAGTTKKTLSQSHSTFPSYLKWVKGGTLYFSGHYNYTATQPGGKFTLTVTYRDGTPPSVLNISIKNTVYGQFDRPLTLASSKVASVTVAATVNPGPNTNAIAVYDLTAEYYRDLVESRASTSVLPLPPAPAR